MHFKTHPWNGEKCKRLPKGRLRNRENVECIEMYIGMYRTKKTELYMYNSKKMELYMYNSKKTELYMYNPKKMELYMYNSKKNGVTHSYTFLYISSFSQVLGQRFLKVHSLFGVCLTKKMRPHGPRLLKLKSSHML